MTNRLDLYKCNICGNVVEVVLSGEGELVCCGENMEHLDIAGHTGDEAAHKPIIEIKEDEKTVRVGEIPHVMDTNHYIQFIEVISDDNKYVKRKYLTPEDKEAILNFKCECKEGIKARELCNIHGLWAN
ncbi:desulfoferrodoxin FeS4 iron-binding domain-containing protein [bacterium]|nr:desulfoferrodoxin FeS4 iron-binding domain-containing protein [bacterium]